MRVVLLFLFTSCSMFSPKKKSIAPPKLDLNIRFHDFEDGERRACLKKEDITKLNTLRLMSGQDN